MKALLSLFDPTRRYDLLYTSVSKTTLVVMTKGGDPSVLTGKVVVTPEAENLSQLPDHEWKEYMRSAFPLIIHNAISSKSFPKDRALTKLMKASEEILEANFENPWVQINYHAGQAGRVVDIKALTELVDDSDRIALGTSRIAFERIMDGIVSDFLVWAEESRTALDSWYMKASQEVRPLAMNS